MGNKQPLFYLMEFTNGHWKFPILKILSCSFQIILVPLKPSFGNRVFAGHKLVRHSLPRWATREVYWKGQWSKRWMIFNFVSYNDQQFLFVYFLIISTFYKQLKSVHAFSLYLHFTELRICFSISFYEWCTKLLTN